VVDDLKAAQVSHSQPPNPAVEVATSRVSKECAAWAITRSATAGMRATRPVLIPLCGLTRRATSMAAMASTASSATMAPATAAFRRCRSLLKTLGMRAKHSGQGEDREAGDRRRDKGGDAVAGDPYPRPEAYMAAPRSADRVGVRCPGHSVLGEVEFLLLERVQRGHDHTRRERGRDHRRDQQQWLAQVARMWLCPNLEARIEQSTRGHLGVLPGLRARSRRRMEGRARA
jgi:hypothetical protein